MTVLPNKITKRYALSILAWVLLPNLFWAQHSLCGTVVSEDAVQNKIRVHLQHHSDNVKTDPAGNFCFASLPAGEYTLYATAAEFESKPVKVLLNTDLSGVILDLLPEDIEHVQITKLSRAAKRKLHSIKTQVIDLNMEAKSSVSVEQLMNRSAGIRVRNSEGLGAEADVVVSGFSGKSVKFLLDGIPIDYLGSSMGLTKMPTNMADFIEVYKGVMPTEVGIDALGGAINIVTKKPTEDQLTASYEVGSFNTHRASLTAFHKINNHLSAGANIFFNYSDNDFKIDNLPFADEATGRTDYIKARLFHNAYKQISGEAFLNVKDLSWADLLQFKVNSFALKRDIQNDFTSRSRPFGGVYRKENGSFIPSLKYQKKLFDDKLELQQFIVYSEIDNDLADPLKNASYDWKGQKHETISGSEMGLDLSNLTEPILKTSVRNLTYRGLFVYHLPKKSRIILNLVDNHLHRKGDDLDQYDTKTIINYNRFIAGLGYEYHALNNRLEGLSQVKYMHSYTRGTLNDPITHLPQRSAENRGWSLAQSLKYAFYNGWSIRSSVENTYRLPDQIEMFGDNVFINPNLSLKPEKSLNFNFGVRYQNQDKYNFEITGYTRNVRDLIRLKDVTQFTSMFLNLDKVRGFGVELEGFWNPWKNLELTGNLTYNEFRFKGSNNNISKNEHFINARVSNMPFYFGNAMASYRFNDFLKAGNKLQLYWNYSYVHQYYLDFIEKQFEPDGFLGLFGKSKINTTRIIPVQQVHSAGFVWTLKRANHKEVALSAQLNNIFNRAIFNNFKMQSAGRNFSAKITYDF